MIWTSVHVSDCLPSVLLRLQGFLKLAVKTIISLVFLERCFCGKRCGTTFTAICRRSGSSKLLPAHLLQIIEVGVHNYVLGCYFEHQPIQSFSQRRLSGGFEEQLIPPPLLCVLAFRLKPFVEFLKVNITRRISVQPQAQLIDFFVGHRDAQFFEQLLHLRAAQSPNHPITITAHIHNAQCTMHNAQAPHTGRSLRCGLRQTF